MCLPARTRGVLVVAAQEIRDIAIRGPIGEVILSDRERRNVSIVDPDSANIRGASKPRTKTSSAVLARLCQAVAEPLECRRLFSGAPILTTSSASGISTTVATLNGTGNALRTADNALLEYSTSPAINVWPGTTTIGSGFGYPADVAVDSVGDVFVADAAYNAVDEIQSNGTIRTLASGFNDPSGVALDSVGDVFVADYGNSAVKEILPNGSIRTLGTGFSNPDSVAVDAAGDVFVADFGNNAIKEILPDGSMRTLGSGLGAPEGVAVDNAGDVFVAEHYDSAILEILPDGSIRTLDTGVNNPDFVSDTVAVDTGGDVFFNDYYHDAVDEMQPDGTVLTLASSRTPTGGGYATGLAVDSAGDVFFGDGENLEGDNIVVEIPSVSAGGSRLLGHFETGVQSLLFSGESGTAKFSLTNATAAALTDDTIDTKFYLETAPSLGHGDIPIDDPTLAATDAPVSTDVDLQPGESTDSLDLHFTIPPATPRGDYYIVGDVIPGDSVSGDSEARANGISEDNTEGGVFSAPVTVSPLTLGELSNKVYNGTDGFGDYNFVDSAAYGGFLANAYENSDGSQVVIAFRGTVPNSLTATPGNVIADATFLGGSPNSVLRTYVEQAASFVAEVHDNLPDAHIALTGHSLGGAIAQLVGNESGLQTVAFNAPGAADLIDALSTELAPCKGLDSGQTDTNYRIDGDIVSMAGNSIGETVTLPPPSGITFSAVGLDDGSSDGAFENFLANLNTLYELHSMQDSVLPSLMSNLPASGATDAPNDASVYDNLAEPSSTSSIDGVCSEEYQEDATEGGEQIFDPSGSDFVLSSQSGSPLFASLDLPTLPGVASFEARYKVNGSWSPYATVMPGPQSALSAAASAIEFQPFDAAGDVVTLASGFDFGVTFASSGTFAGTLVASGLSTSATVGALTPKITSENVKRSLVGGKPTHGKFTIDLTNDSGVMNAGRVTVDLYASRDGVIDSDSILIGKLTRNIKLRAGRAIHIPVGGTLPATLVGKYTLLAAAIDPAGFTSDAPTGPIATVASPFVSLAAAIDAVSPRAVAMGKTVTLKIVLTNVGNIDSAGIGTFSMGLSSDGKTIAVPVVPSQRKSVIVTAGGKPTTVTLRFKIPSGYAVGSYFPVLTFAQGSTKLTAIGSVPFSVVNPRG